MMNVAKMSPVVIDPVCGMEIDPVEAPRTRQMEDQTFYFCSNYCAELFDPEMTEAELARLRAIIGVEPNRRRTIPLWWVMYWARKGIQALKERYPGGKS